MMDYIKHSEDLKFYFSEIRRFSVLTAEEEIELAKKIEENDTVSFNKMVNSNLKLVVRIAKNYTGRGLPLADLVSEGNIGLMKSVKKYNYKKGFRFSVYSAWWIKQSILRAISDKSRIIRVPFRGNEAIKHADYAFNILADANKTTPNIKEISEEIHVPYESLIKFLASEKISSLDSLGEPGSFLDFIPDRRESFEEGVIYNSLKEKLGIILSSVLDKKELDIIQKRFGFNGYPIYSLERIGIEYGVTRERIRQIEEKVLKRLKNNSHIKKLASCLKN